MTPSGLPTADRKAPTILDVARLSGVSKSTVSNVVRGIQTVSPATHRRVLEAIARLGYRPNVLARHLVQQRTTILGVMVGDLANPFHAQMAQLVERYAADSGYTTIFCNTGSDPSSETARIGTLLEHRVAGIVFLTFSGDPAAIGETLVRNVPIAFVSCREEYGDSVTVDDLRGGELATTHLIDLGHRRLAYLTVPDVEERTNRARLAGFHRALELADIEPQLELRWQPPNETVEIGGDQRPLVDLFRGPDRITGVFASNDFAAIDLIEFADRVGLDVPDELSVVGYDNVPLSSLARIGLTTVAQPPEELSRVGIETLVARIEGRLAGPLRHVIAGVELIVRGSTAPLKDSSRS